MLSKRHFASTLVLAAALAACSPNPATRFATAEEAFAANDFRAARISLIAGLKEQPGDHEMRLLLARAQLALGDGEGAASSLDALPAEFASQPRVAIVRAESDILRGRFDEALAGVAEIEAGAADRIRALAYIGQEKFDQAAEAFAVGAARDEVDPRLLAAYGRFALANGEGDKAAELVEQAIESDPQLVEAHLVNGLVRESRNDLSGALMAYDRALELHPDNFDGRLGKAQMLARLDRFEEAAGIADALSAEAPEDRSIAFLKARIAAGEGEWKAVRKILQPYENELRSAAGLPAIYGESLIEIDQPALALGVLEPELSRQPNSRPLRRLVARAQLAGGDARAALGTIRPLASRADATPAELRLAARAAERTGSSSAEEFVRRAEMPSAEWVGGELAKADQALRNRQWRDAETRYESILSRTRSDNAMVLNNLAFAKEKLGKEKQALEIALRAAKLEPDNASILDTAGWLLVQTGSRARGLEMLRRAAKLDPENPTIQRHLTDATKG
ncbi:tetratricopeptide repeat protein [Qipengyuania sp. G39]|uniref:Tetratricopeptide repeat protein n=1 Tax=Qipengyuania profundimaris TaxID=3067652 RepID=A0ABT9HPW4_9SPHN|nr:tetratricopeptide repeat protein [Qipengyuania sp. G39]MDP4575186.1 tetratricopeptide repeat protein [Qipengyuania sp. G39]